MKRFIVYIVAVVAAGSACPAQAAWVEATTKHFRIFADTDDSDVRKLATDLERFDSVIRRYHQVPDTAEALANPVVIYVVKDVEDLQRLYGAVGSGIAGFYRAEGARAVAFTPARAGLGSKRDLNPRIILFHEYAHHFLLQNSGVAYPYWFGEGYAEFVSTVTFDDRYATIGKYALHRYFELFYNSDEATIRQLFDPPTNSGIDVYARGWLLTHFIMFNPERKTQFARYIEYFNAGMAPVAAAEKAFGSLAALNTQLNTYKNLRAFPALSIALTALPTPTVTLRPLSPGATAMIAFRTASARGVDDKSAGPLYARAAPVAAKYPDDPEVQGWLAEIAFDARQYDAADGAADRALTKDPKSVQALLYKARVAMARAGSDPKAWNAARAFILRANAVAADNPETLSLFYRSFRDQGVAPSKGAITALYRAALVLPQDEYLRYLAMRQLLVDGDLASAIRVIRPAAYNPHGTAANGTREFLTALEAANTPAEGLAAIDKIEADAKAKAKAKTGKNAQVHALSADRGPVPGR